MNGQPRTHVNDIFGDTTSHMVTIFGIQWGGEAYFRRRLLAFYDVVGQFMTSSYGAKMTSKTVEMTSQPVGMTSQIVAMTSQIFMEFTCLVGHFFASSSAV